MQMTERSTQMTERWLDALDCGADDGRSTQMTERSTPMTERWLDALA